MELEQELHGLKEPSVSDSETELYLFGLQVQAPTC